jgi:hypothetical protein
MKKSTEEKQDSDIDEKKSKEKDESQRVAPSRKYSVLEDDGNLNFVEDYQKIETF